MRRLQGRVCSKCMNEMPKTKKTFPWANDPSKPEWCSVCIDQMFVEIMREEELN